MDDIQITQAHAALQEELRRLAELAPPALSDEATPPQRAAQLARLHAAEAALRLAAALLAPTILPRRRPSTTSCGSSTNRSRCGSGRGRGGLRPARSYGRRSSAEPK